VFEAVELEAKPTEEVLGRMRKLVRPFLCLLKVFPRFSRPELEAPYSPSICIRMEMLPVLQIFKCKIKVAVFIQKLEPVVRYGLLRIVHVTQSLTSSFWPVTQTIKADPGRRSMPRRH